MKCNFIDIKDVLDIGSFQLIDVRSPSEYHSEKIPGAVNIPILTDEERAIVGTIYCQVNPNVAVATGFQLAAPKMQQLLDEISKFQQKQVVLYCWRGGMRSQSLAKLCSKNNICVRVLMGGYKAYRKHVNQYWQKELKFKTAVLHGQSGVGKTRLLKELALLGVPILDLEGLARNRGSVFGVLNGIKQPSQKDFEADMFESCRKNKSSDIVVLECESRKIGNNHIPLNLYTAMEKGYQIHLYTDFSRRVENILEDYGNMDKEYLKSRVILLTKFIGKSKIELIIKSIEQNRMNDAVSILLRNYYDPLYGYAIKSDSSYDLSVDCNNLQNAAHRIWRFLQLS